MTLETLDPTTLVRDFAKIKHLNIRKEGESRVLAVDIKMTGAPIKAGTLALLTGCPEPDLCWALWDPEGEKRIRMIKPIQSEVELTGCRMTLGRGITLIGTAKKFTFEVIANHQANLDWQFSVSDPGNSTTSRLADLVDEEIDVELVILQQQLFDGEAA